MFSWENIILGITLLAAILGTIRYWDELKKQFDSPRLLLVLVICIIWAILYFKPHPTFNNSVEVNPPGIKTPLNNPSVKNTSSDKSLQNYSEPVINNKIDVDEKNLPSNPTSKVTEQSGLDDETTSTSFDFNKCNVDYSDVERIIGESGNKVVVYGPDGNGICTLKHKKTDSLIYIYLKGGKVVTCPL